MAFIPGFDHDLFVSYAHLDNDPMGVEVEGWVKPSDGWVDALVKKVQSELSKRVGSGQVRAYMDPQLDGNRPITPELLSAVRRSALLMVVMSPSYLHSEWCKRERHAFLATVQSRVESGSVFVVHARQVERKDIPSEFGDLLGYPFWMRDSDVGADRPLGIPNPLEPKFINKIFGLSHSLGEQLRRARDTSPASYRSRSVSSHPPTGSPVFVARSTEDLEDREDELKSYLSQAGIATLPQTWYPQTEERAFERAMIEDLEKCKLFVQLLSASRGRELPFSSRPRLPRRQADIAARADKPLLQWRDRAIDLTSVDDADHRSLLEGARADGIEDFKRAVAEAAKKDSPPERTRAASVMVFLNANGQDRALARQVGDALRQLRVECAWPMENGSPDAVRKDFEDNLRTCDGLLLVYGSAGASWVRNQLRQGRKILSQRDEPPSALAIFEGPPPEKTELAVPMPDWVTLDCRGGLDNRVLQQFVQDLRR
jgi:hypothetical protein